MSEIVSGLPARITLRRLSEIMTCWIGIIAGSNLVHIDKTQSSLSSPALSSPRDWNSGADIDTLEWRTSGSSYRDRAYTMIHSIHSLTRSWDYCKLVHKNSTLAWIYSYREIPGESLYFSLKSYLRILSRVFSHHVREFCFLRGSYRF